MLPRQIEHFEVLTHKCMAHIESIRLSLSILWILLLENVEVDNSRLENRKNINFLKVDFKKSEFNDSNAIRDIN